ncbi:transcription factor HES-7.1-like [Ambystoma mexicanum]|uniref:transcription factor HES-7.1-like n=1 Tax=Ambystoma mexicanum TaxID=8296 RepID=UPI0037E73568
MDMQSSHSEQWCSVPKHQKQILCGSVIDIFLPQSRQFLNPDRSVVGSDEDAVENEKFLKPMVEKRRRERINSSLESLRMLLLEKRPNEKLKNPKVEKAEILENTVQFIRAQNQSLEALPNDWQTYQAGYHDCLQRAIFFLNANKDADQERKAFLNGYLTSCLNQLQSSSVPRPPGASSLRATINGPQLEPDTISDSEASSARILPLLPLTDILPFNSRRGSELQTPQPPSCAQQQSLQEGSMHINRTVGAPTNNDFPAPSSSVWRPWP